MKSRIQVRLAFCGTGILTCCLLVSFLAASDQVKAGPCYGLDECNKGCPSRCTNPDCRDPCDSGCPNTYNPCDSSCPAGAVEYQVTVSPDLMFPGCKSTVTITPVSGWTDPSQILVFSLTTDGFLCTSSAGYLEECGTAPDVCAACEHDGSCTVHTSDTGQVLPGNTVSTEFVAIRPSDCTGPICSHPPHAAVVDPAEACVNGCYCAEFHVYDPTLTVMGLPPAHYTKPGGELGYYMGLNDGYHEQKGAGADDFADPDPTLSCTPDEPTSFASMAEGFTELLVSVGDTLHLEPTRVATYLTPSGPSLRVLAIASGTTPVCRATSDPADRGNCWLSSDWNAPDDDPSRNLTDVYDTFYAEGAQPGESSIAYTVKLVDYGKSYTTPPIYFTVCQVDADVDSDNTQILPPFVADGSDAEDAIESKAGQIGRYAEINSNDDDNDGIADFIDGYNKNGILGDDDDSCSAENDFVQIDVKIAPDTLDLTPYSLGLAVHYDSTRMRLWKVAGTVDRDGRAITRGGDYIPPSTSYSCWYIQYLTPDGVAPSHHLKFYAEILPGAAAGDNLDITFRLAPDGMGPARIVHSDTVRLTVTPVNASPIVLFNCDDDNQDTGTATLICSGSPCLSTIELQDTTKTWTNNQWANGHFILTSSDPSLSSCAGDVDWNTSNTLRVRHWYTDPFSPGTSEYKVFDGRDSDTWYVDGPNDEDDMLEISISPLANLPVDHTVAIWTDRPSELRLWDMNHDENTGYIGTALIGKKYNLASGLTETIGQTEITQLARNGAVLHLEGLTFPKVGFDPARIRLELRVRNAAQEVVSRYPITVQVAPWLMIPHTYPANTVMAMQVNGWSYGDNLPFIQELQTVLGSSCQFWIVNGQPYGDDLWMQDWFEVGYTAAPYKQFHVAANTTRGNADPAFAEFELMGPDFGWFDLGWREDIGCSGSGGVEGGNIEVSPAVTTADGKHYPLGRIVHGSIDCPNFLQFLAAQRGMDPSRGPIQSAVAVDTSFLAVKHIDELFSFLPAPLGSQGFLVARTSPGRAIELDCPTWPIVYCSWGEAPENDYLESRIQASQQQLMDDTSGLNLAGSDFLFLPVWYTPDNSGGGIPYDFWAASEDLTNGLYVCNACSASSSELFVMPLPYDRLENLCTTFINEADSVFAVHGLGAPSYVFDSDWYHDHWGEIHCGTNTIRVLPDVKWWEQQ